MLSSRLTALLCLLPVAWAVRPPPPPPPASSLLTPDFTNNTVFSPPSSWTSKGTSYARTAVLRHDCSNTILASFTASFPGNASLPVFQSKDNGKTWTDLSRIYFKQGDYAGGAIWQPFLYELPARVGRFPAGTILASGNGIPRGFGSTNIEVHASLDKGKTWEFVSLVATGTAPNTNNGAHPIWEPFLLYHNGELGVFYSDQRDPLHGQKLAHQRSKDLINWGPVVNDVAMGNYTVRPGMTTIAQIGAGKDAKFMLSYEVGLAPGPVEFAVGYRISDSPFTFDSAPDIPLVATDGTVPAAGPYTVWSPAGGPNGTIVLSDSTYPQVFTNTMNGDPKHWIKQEVAPDQGVSYTRSLTVLPDKQGKKVLFANGGYYGLRSAFVSVGEWVVPGLPAQDAPCVPGA
ncbi:hypothetical protein CVT24_004356 [Panaeolus cyanescens]|uniref:Sialidase domain-containing protein n=1 Tax=Panaeolus cyanescens TaxID=181874 RepID=A0A409W7T0_9AGAR|nr:hypothetical protein CVT24_004356 [Panaeolus cyanescens]